MHVLLYNMQVDFSLLVQLWSVLYSWKVFSLFLNLEINALSGCLWYETNGGRSLMKSKPLLNCFLADKELMG